MLNSTPRGHWGFCRIAAAEDPQDAPESARDEHLVRLVLWRRRMLARSIALVTGEAAVARRFGVSPE
jgi:hypothetical protein